MDIIWVALASAFFALSAGLVRLFDRLATEK